MAKTYIVNMVEFTGYNEILEHHDLKALYKIVLSEARAAGNNLINRADAAIKDNTGRPICRICNYYGQVIIAGSYNAVTVREG